MRRFVGECELAPPRQSWICVCRALGASSETGARTESPLRCMRNDAKTARCATSAGEPRESVASARHTGHLPQAPRAPAQPPAPTPRVELLAFAVVQRPPPEQPRSDLSRLARLARAARHCCGATSREGDVAKLHRATSQATCSRDFLGRKLMAGLPFGAVVSRSSPLVPRFRTPHTPAHMDWPVYLPASSGDALHVREVRLARPSVGGAPVAPPTRRGVGKRTTYQGYTCVWWDG